MKVRSLIVILALGCGGSQKTPEPTALAEILLDDAGGHPRQKLRYEPTLHAPERTEVVTSLKIADSSGRNEDVSVKTTTRFEALSLAANGDAQLGFLIEKVDVLDASPNVRASLDRKVAASLGMHGTLHRAPDGTISDASVDGVPSEEAREKLTDLVESMRDVSALFPDTSIGVGATWHATSERVEHHVKYTLTATYHLKALDNDVATIDLEATLNAPHQALDVEPGAFSELTSGTGRTTAELTVPLHGLAFTGTAQGTLDIRYRIQGRHAERTGQLVFATLVTVRPARTD